MQSKRLERQVETLGSLLRTACAQLGSESEARWLVSHSSAVPSSQLSARMDDEVSAQTVARTRALLSRLEDGEPLQYVLGTWGFRSLEVAVDRRVLIPRPETEVVVEKALLELAGSSGSPHAVVADLGTGSGVVALSLALEAPAVLQDRSEIEIWATDTSADALEVARENLDRLAARDLPAASRVHIVQGDWYEALPQSIRGRVQLIVSNPPYVSESQWTTLDPLVRDHEPRSALVAGSTGLEALSVLIDEAPSWLTSSGRLVLELSPEQARDAQEMAVRAGFDDVGVHPDLAGRPRVLVARLVLSSSSEALETSTWSP